MSFSIYTYATVTTLAENCFFNWVTLKKVRNHCFTRQSTVIMIRQTRIKPKVLLQRLYSDAVETVSFK